MEIFDWGMGKYVIVLIQLSIYNFCLQIVLLVQPQYLICLVLVYQYDDYILGYSL